VSSSDDACGVTLNFFCHYALLQPVEAYADLSPSTWVRTRFDRLKEVEGSVRTRFLRGYF
jgi:hypothetical protein